MTNRIYKGYLEIMDEFSGQLVRIEGWKYEGYYGLFDSYVSALAHSMELWDEYCEYHRLKTE